MATPAMPPFVRLTPILLPKVWGGDALAQFGLPVESGAQIGEAWLLADLRTTAAGGAGGGPVCSPVVDAEPASLAALVAAAPAHWLGDVPPAEDGGFPLLVKLLDAREHLSVQAHPSPAAARGDERVKHECWLVLDAAPGAELFLGLRPGVSEEALAEAEGASIVPLLERVPAVPGECHLLPSGMIHALGAGVLALEVQTPSDTTFRLYDWTDEYERPARALHVARARAAWAPDARADTRTMPTHGAGCLAAAAAFRVEGLVLPDGGTAPMPRPMASPRMVVPLDGPVELRAQGQRMTVPRGTAALLAGAVTEAAVHAETATRVVIAWPIASA